MKIVTIFIQVLLIHVFLFLAIGIQWLFSIPFPVPIIGLFLLLIALSLKIIKLEWVEKGANWLMFELLLFFIPSAVGIINYDEIFSWQGVGSLFVIGLSTFIVMVVTAWIVDRWKGGSHS